MRQISILVIILLLGAAALPMANAAYTTTLGTTDITGLTSNYISATDQAGGQLITIPEGINKIVSISVYLKYAGDVSKAKFCLWDSDYSVLGVTAEVAPTASSVWYTRAFTSPISVTPGRSYYIGLVSNDTSCGYPGVTDAAYTWKIDITNSFATPQSITGATTETRKLAIYATVSGPEAAHGLNTNIPLLVAVIPVVVVLFIFGRRGPVSGGAKAGGKVWDNPIVSTAIVVGVLTLLVAVFYGMGV